MKQMNVIERLFPKVEANGTVHVADTSWLTPNMNVRFLITMIVLVQLQKLVHLRQQTHVKEIVSDTTCQ